MQIKCSYGIHVNVDLLVMYSITTLHTGIHVHQALIMPVIESIHFILNRLIVINLCAEYI